MRLSGKMYKTIQFLLSNRNYKLLVINEERRQVILKTYPELNADQVILPPKPKNIKPIVFLDEMTEFSHEDLMRILKLKTPAPRSEESDL